MVINDLDFHHVLTAVDSVLVLLNELMVLDVAYILISVELISVPEGGS